jgi:hypothetical protein
MLRSCVWSDRKNSRAGFASFDDERRFTASARSAEILLWWQLDSNGPVVCAKMLLFPFDPNHLVPLFPKYTSDAEHNGSFPYGARAAKI